MNTGLRMKETELANVNALYYYKSNTSRKNSNQVKTECLSYWKTLDWD